MRTFTIEVTEAIADRWTRLAKASRVPTEFWMAFCLHTCERLEFPVTQLILRIPPADRRQAGVYWEVSRFEQSSGEGECLSMDPRESVRQRLERVADHRCRLHAFAEDATT